MGQNGVVWRDEDCLAEPRVQLFRLAGFQRKSPRLLAELHRDSLYSMMGKDVGWLGLTMGKPQGRSLCVWGVASGSAASHPAPGSTGMVEFSEESRGCACRYALFERGSPTKPGRKPRKFLHQAASRSLDLFGKCPDIFIGPLRTHKPEAQARAIENAYRSMPSP